MSLCTKCSIPFAKKVSLIHPKKEKKKKKILGDFYIPVGIPSTFEPRPSPLMTGPPMYQDSIGKVPSTPAIHINSSVKNG